MRVIDLAKSSGVSGHTIRYYTRCGLLKPVKDGSGYHRYSEADEIRLGFIRCLRELYLPLDKIAELLGLAENGGLNLDVIHDSLQQELLRERHEVEDKLAVMQRLLKVMVNWDEMEGKREFSLSELELLLKKLESD